MFFFFFGAWLSWLWPFLRKAVDCLHARYLQKSQANMVACAVHPGIIGTGLGGVIKAWDGVEINIDALDNSRDFAWLSSDDPAKMQSEMKKLKHFLLGQHGFVWEKKGQGADALICNIQDQCSRYYVAWCWMIFWQDFKLLVWTVMLVMKTDLVEW